MAVTAARPLTKIATWGNSEAVRIPRSVLRAVGLGAGDDVEVRVNERNRIELVPKQQVHRRVRPTKGVSFDSLFAGYDPAKLPPAPAWPDDDFVGAELEAWSR